MIADLPNTEFNRHFLLWRHWWVSGPSSGTHGRVPLLSCYIKAGAASLKMDSVQAVMESTPSLSNNHPYPDQPEPTGRKIEACELRVQ